MKVFFPKRIDGKFFPCPFIGFRANTPDEFKKIIKSFFNKETGYPGLFFTTADKDRLLVFSGHQYVHPEGKPFRFHNIKTDTVEDLNGDGGWFSLNNWDGWFNLLEDAEEIDRKIDVLSNIVKQQGGLTIQIK